MTQSLNQVIMNIAGHDIGVCSWSLGASDTQDMIARVKALGLQHVQLGLGSLVMLDDKRRHQEVGLLRASGLTLVGGMIAFPGEDYTTIAHARRASGFAPEKEFPLRRQLAISAGQLAVELGIKRVSLHVGFVPPSSDPAYQTLADRVCQVAEKFGSMGLTLLMESGQEPATELLQFLNDLRCQSVLVNFDPANMLLYGAGDPIEALGILGRHIGHVHVKDAMMSEQPGTAWGTEVPFGQGQVPPREFLAALASAGYTGPLSIERKSGDDPMGDVAQAIRTLREAADEQEAVHPNQPEPIL